MAEVAAGAIVAEQVVVTGVEAGAAAAIARPTQPLTAVLKQIAAAPVNDDALALARSHHTVSIIDNKAYIFGGKKEDGRLCSNDIHSVSLASPQEGEPEYACYPAVRSKGAVAAPRWGHAACTRGDTVIIHGGKDDLDQSADQEGCLWVWDSKTIEWTKISAGGNAPESRINHQIFYDQKKDRLVLHGGTEREKQETDTWLFYFQTSRWIGLPQAPTASSAAQFVDGTLYGITSSSGVDGCIHFLRLGSSEDVSTLSWSTVEYPANPLNPGPRPRLGSALVPVSTGLGRQYLIYLLGSRQDAKAIAFNDAYTQERPLYSDMWSLQLPSEGFSASGVKDAIRDKLPRTESGVFSWCELEIAPNEVDQQAGKVHPGPRAFFGADACLDGKGVVFWGGVNAKGETEGDGWLLTVS
ncbi:hypothetical protein ACJ41O_010382 [Fusarium nematophilum]